MKNSKKYLSGSKNDTAKSAAEFIKRSAEEFLNHQMIEPKVPENTIPKFFVPGPRIMQ